MAEKKRNRDGIFQRRGQYWMSFQDSRGQRHQCVLKGVISLTEAKRRRALKISEIEKHKLLGYVPPTKDTFAEIISRYLRHQDARLSPKAYERTRGIIELHLKSFFGTMQLAGIRR